MTPRHRHQPVGARRAVRAKPRYGRVAALGAAAVVTLVSVAGGIGLLPSESPPAHAMTVSDSLPGGLSHQDAAEGAAAQAATAPQATAESTPSAHASAPAVDPTALPPDSGTGRRIVFDQSDQRVWLVGADGVVQRTYLVSGSLTDNLQPGTYAVYSKSRWAVGVDDSGVMQYFVRFAHGNNAAIGFHDIPEHLGKPLQKVSQLGTPLSHGCIRQDRTDAIALWTFAPVGTKVVVTA